MYLVRVRLLMCTPACVCALLCLCVNLFACVCVLLYACVRVCEDVCLFVIDGALSPFPQLGPAG